MSGSTFTNYETKAATDYDIVRLPVGIEVILIRLYVPIKDILDTGDEFSKIFK